MKKVKLSPTDTCLFGIFTIAISYLIPAVITYGVIWILTALHFNVPGEIVQHPFLTGLLVWLIIIFVSLF